MPDDSSVDIAVEKMLAGKAPTEDPVKETPSEEAPATTATATANKDAETSKETPSEEAAELTAFEQELIAEFKEEYDSAGDQKAFLNALKRSYRKQAKQMTELGTLRKAVGALRDAGVTNEDLVALVTSKRNGKPTTATTASAESKAERGYQRWLTQAKTPEERESLRDAEQVVRELVEDLVSERLTEVREKEVKPLRERLEWQDRQAITKRSQTLDQEINDLEDKLGYPGSLVETHRAAMHALGIREPTLSVEDLLVRAAGFQTVKSAMLKSASKLAVEPNGTDRKGTTNPPGSVVKKPAASELPKNPRGVISISKALDLLVRPKR